MKIFIGQKDFDIRGLTRKEVFGFKGRGITFQSALDKMDEESPDVDEILRACTGEDPAGLTPHEAMVLMVAASKLTFMGETDAGNFLRSLSTGLPGGSVDATDAKPEDPAAENGEA
ncbi:MAG: hypothetical protein HZB23_15530 [Deltaproteobacteria bacterium]|nr:hypothetical protein [Deltaproteobacteria bacterium]